MVPFQLLIQNLDKVAKFNYIIIYVLIIFSFPSKELKTVNKAQRMPYVVLLSKAQCLIF